MWVLYLKTVITCNSTSHMPFCTTTKVSRKSVTIYMSSWKFWVVFTFKFGHKWTFYINVGSLKEYCNLKKNVLVKPCIVSQLVNVQMAEFLEMHVLSRGNVKSENLNLKFKMGLDFQI